MSLAIPCVSSFQLEKRSNLCEPSSVSEAFVAKVAISGRTSASVSGSMSLKDSG